MTAGKDNGGPAFPIPADYDNYRTEGMTLLDYFAGKALPWCLDEFGGNAKDDKQFAEAAYQIADAMLAERRRRTEPKP